jgi:branched-chain amino acid transport system substrate-binding protein
MVVRRGRTLAAVMAVAGMVAAGCSSDDSSEPVESTDGSVAVTTAGVGTAVTAPLEPETTTAESTPATSAPEDEDSGDTFTAKVAAMGPATGEPMKVGLVNTEGVPGLDLVEIRENIEATVAYLNDHGGFGGRPIELTTCASQGSPESSQACAQEVVGNDPELVLLGLDIFPGYPTFDAAGVPVVGLLPILPGDYTADALFTTGGNATLSAGMAGVAKEQFGAESVGIISADTAGTNGTETALTDSLDKLGITWVSIKGGAQETDAGFQGLMSQATQDDPDLLITLYDTAGCIGTMRGRVALGIDTPVLATSECAATEVIEQVGDDALGWTFLGAQTNDDTPANALIREIMAPELGVAVDEVDPASLGIGGLGILQMMTLAKFADAVAESGTEVTGQSIYDHFGSTTESIWPSGLPVECGKAPAYPAICTFEFPVIQYTADGTLQPAPGFEVVSAFDFLP